MKHRSIFGIATSLALALAGVFTATDGQAAAPTCERYVTANIVALDQPVMFNRLGASNINGMIFALERDVINKTSGLTLNIGGAKTPGNVALRPDKRPRPLVLRVRRGDCLTVNLTNLLAPARNPGVNPGVPDFGDIPVNDQVLDRHVSFHVSGMQYMNGPGRDDGSYVGANADSTVPQSLSKTHVLYAEREGAFLVQSLATTVGSDANQGNSSNLLFGQVIVEPTGSAIYRGQVAEEEMRLSADANNNGALDTAEKTLHGHPIINYEKTYPPVEPWITEGKAGLPVLNMMNCNSAGTSCEIVHSEINAIVAYGPNGKMSAPGADPHRTSLGHFPPSTYPLEGLAGMRNPTIPNRLEPFRDFASVWHDEPATKQAFPRWFDDRQEPTQGQFRYVLAGVKDGFMINYGSGGIGSEIIANRLRVGPMHDCLTCAYEEFFLTSFTVGDPATLVDIPANIGLENCNPSLVNCEANGPKATKGLYTEDPANIHHSYVGDFAKFRNTHVGKEQHVFHLHNHQWLYNPNDDNSNYLDAQGIGPGVGYTYEINFGGSGNRNKSSGDAIFHCHFYPHFAQGMWYHWRHHDVFEAGTVLAVTPNVNGDPTGFHAPFAGGLGLGDGTPANNGAFQIVACADTAGVQIPPVGGACPATNPNPVFGPIPTAAFRTTTRALPDAEVPVGVPIPAVVPLPGKPMAPMPGRVAVVPNTNTVCVGPAPTFGLQPANPDGTCPAGTALRPTGSLAKVVDRPSAATASGVTTLTGKNPGFPFWIAGIEDLVGQRPPTPVLDMVDRTLAGNLNNKYNVTILDAVNNSVQTVTNLFGDLKPAQADGFHGGLPRGAMEGYAAGGFSIDTNSPIDLSKVVEEAQGVFYPEEGTDIEKVAMAYHAIRNHPSFLPDGKPGSFVLNGQKPAVGAPYHEPCADDRGVRLAAGITGKFFGPGLTTEQNFAGMTVSGSSVFNADNPRIYKGAQIQYDAVFNKVGYHYPQQRIIALWEDAVPVVTKQKPGQPLVMRFNTFECGVYHHTNLTPEAYELDDYQVRTPTDIIGQHIHLPKWDLTTADGAANGWNYEDGTLAAGAVRERIRALNAFVAVAGHAHKMGTGSGSITAPGTLAALPHPFFGDGAAVVGVDSHKDGLWKGARTTIQRWFVDPVVNTEGVDRGLGIIFTHDHYGPSTHQQIGLYATVLVEPAGSFWAHNETGQQLGDRTRASAQTATRGVYVAGDGGRIDGGPTAWQAAIIPRGQTGNNSADLANVGEEMDPYREFYFEYSDFQHAYEAGVYVGADQRGAPLPGAGPGQGPKVMNAGNPDFDGTAANAFRFAINPPAREQIAVGPVFPDLVNELASTLGQVDNFCPARPCPQAIDVQDPGMGVVNYRNEPIGLRIYDPAKIGPDGKPGMQADGPAGDLAYALRSSLGKDSADVPILRKIAALNSQPVLGTSINGTTFPAPINTSGVGPGDPFTPMLRAFAGDLIRVKMQAGGHEEEHNATIHGVKWLQAGSGHGKAPNSGWRNAQAGGISEQFTLAMPVVPSQGQGGATDYAYSMDASQDGWFSGMWGILRAYNNNRNDLFKLPTTIAPVNVANSNQFNGICPKLGPTGAATPVRSYDITAALANDILPANAPVTIQDLDPAGHAGNWPLAAAGGTLVYNPRPGPLGKGPIHDPTAILYVRTADIDRLTGKLFANIKVEPLVLRAAAGDCIEVTLRNRLPAFDNLVIRTVNDPITGFPVNVTVPQSRMPDLATFTTVQGVVKRDRGIALLNGVPTVTNPEGSTTFQPNLYRPSGYVGLRPQLVAYDITTANGTAVGDNPAGQGKSGVIGPGDVAKFQWYAGDITPTRTGTDNNRRFRLDATPVEFGGVNLMPTDQVKQAAKGLVGALVIEPRGTFWDEDGDDAAGRQSATVKKANPDGTVTTLYRDFSAVFTKALTHYYRDGSQVEHINGEDLGIPEDSQEASGMAINYGTEPMWFRAGIPPQSDFGPLGYGGIDPQFDLYSNPRAGGDPATPVFLANRNQPFRVRVTNPYGTSRGTTFQLHGHLWQRDPYICVDPVTGAPKNKNGIDGRCATTEVGSTGIGDNKQAFYQGAQESITPATHFDIVPTQTGVPGDYLFRDSGSFGNASGLWGILRVQ